MNAAQLAKNPLVTLLVVAVGTYCVLCVYLYWQQRALIYFPQFTRSDPAATDFQLDRGSAVLRGWVVNPEAGDPVLYFGGNAERIESNREAFATLFPGRSVYLLAYRGYGASDGEPSEAVLVPDALALFDEVQGRHPGQGLAIVGRSLGSGIASQVAAQRPAERLVLITPFDSMVATAKSHYPIFPIDRLLNERYESAKALARFDRPVLIVHAGRDDVVPEANTLRLIAALPAKPEIVRIASADHNDILEHREFHAAVIAFMTP